MNFPTDDIIACIIISNAHFPLFSAVKYADKEVKVSEIKAGVRVPVNQSCAVLDCLKKKKKKKKRQSREASNCSKREETE